MVKIFVGGFPQNTPEIELVQLIAIYGKVCTIKIVRDKKTQKSKGYAFLEMGTREDAERTIEALNGKTMGSRELAINIVEKPPVPASASPARSTPAHKPFVPKSSAPASFVPKATAAVKPAPVTAAPPSAPTTAPSAAAPSTAKVQASAAAASPAATASSAADRVTSREETQPEVVKKKRPRKIA